MQDIVLTCYGSKYLLETSFFNHLSDYFISTSDYDYEAHMIAFRTGWNDKKNVYEAFFYLLDKDDKIIRFPDNNKTPLWVRCRQKSEFSNLEKWKHPYILKITKKERLTYRFDNNKLNTEYKVPIENDIQKRGQLLQFEEDNSIQQRSIGDDEYKNNERTINSETNAATSSGSEDFSYDGSESDEFDWDWDDLPDIDDYEEDFEMGEQEKIESCIIQNMIECSEAMGLKYERRDLINFHTSLKSSYLTILSGLSGTGKSKIVEMYAKALGLRPFNPLDLADEDDSADNDRLLFIPVRPSWNDDSDLLGYVDIVHMVYRPSDIGFVDFIKRAGEHPDDLYMVCFDEMNLARVEHYFSQFLSLLERNECKYDKDSHKWYGDRMLKLYDRQYEGRLYNSKEFPCEIAIPSNIRFVGTVNLDESTYHFSDKVLDRANVIKLDIVNFTEDMPQKGSWICADPITYNEYNSIIIQDNDVTRNDDLRKLLYSMHSIMSSASEKYGVGPRIVKAIEKYVSNLPNDALTAKDAIDLQICQRVLTKVRGPENQIKAMLKADNQKDLSHLLNDYSGLSDFTKSKKMLEQKNKELEAYGYCI